MIMILIVAAVGGFMGRFVIGFPLNFILKPQERDDPNPENWLGWIGSAIGALVAIWLYTG